MKIAVKKNKDLSIYTITIHDTYKNYMYELTSSVDMNGNILPKERKPFDPPKLVVNDDSKRYYKFSDEFYSYTLDENISFKDFTVIFEMFCNFLKNKHEVLKLISQYNEMNLEKIQKKNIDEDNFDEMK